MVNTNVIKLQDGRIFIKIIGEQNFQVTDKTTRAATKHIVDLRRQKKPVLILIDIKKLKGHDSAARNRAKEFYKLDYDKIAFMGADAVLHNLTLYLAGPKNSRKIKFFNSKNAAIKWLDHAKEPGFSLKEYILKPTGILMVIAFLTGTLVTLFLTLALNSNIQTESRYRAIHATQASAGVLSTKIESYLTALHGFKSFFSASDFVSQQDFHNYFENLDLAERYPGLSGVTYIPRISSARKEEAIHQIQREVASLDSPLASYTIKNSAEQDYYYPILYIEPHPTDDYGYGLDLSTMPARYAALQKAHARNSPIASESFTMVTGALPTNEKGFLITIPVSGGFAGADGGYINAVFDYKQLFGRTDELKHGPFKIFDQANKEIYISEKVQPGYVDLASSSINVADKKWQLSIFGFPDFGLSNLERLSPLFALVSGLLITLLGLFVLYNLLNSRKSAFDLADQITEDLQVAEHKHELMINSIKDYAIYMIDPQGRVTSWNSGAEQISGYRANEIIGKNNSIFYDKLHKKVPTHLRNQARSGGKATSQGWRIRKDGSKFWASVHLNAVRDEDGKLLGFTNVTRDMTRQRELEQERDNFIAIATHELKTPITSVKAYAQVLFRRFTKASDTSSADLLGRMDEQIDKLTKLVSDLLDVSKIETGKLEFSKKKFDMNELVKDVTEEIGRTTEKHPVHLRGKISQKVYGDEYRIGQILTNLIENAIKYSGDSGDIDVTIEPGKNDVKVHVTDRGPGIRHSDQSRIFERFYRAKDGKRSAGFGLGLFISAEIAKEHNGRITLNSEVGKGSTFTLVLPIKADNG